MYRLYGTLFVVACGILPTLPMITWMACAIAQTWGSLANVANNYVDGMRDCANLGFSCQRCQQLRGWHVRLRKLGVLLPTLPMIIWMPRTWGSLANVPNECGWRRGANMWFSSQCQRSQRLHYVDIVAIVRTRPMLPTFAKLREQMRVHVCGVGTLRKRT